MDRMLVEHPMSRPREFARKGDLVRPIAAFVQPRMFWAGAGAGSAAGALCRHPDLLPGAPVDRNSLSGPARVTPLGKGIERRVRCRVVDLTLQAEDRAHGREQRKETEGRAARR